MGRSQETFNKKEVRAKKEKRRKEKEQKRLAKKELEKSGKLEDMIAYVDENGNITASPPDPTKKKKINSKDIRTSVPKQDSLPAPDPIRHGKVTYFNDAKGFGFIEDSETRERIFVHINNTLDDIKVDNLVTFEIVMGQKGPTATDVKLSK